MSEKIRAWNKFDACCRIARFCSYLAGMDLLSATYKFNWISATVLTAILVFYVFSILAILKSFSDDPAIILEVFTTIGITTQGFAKFLSGVRYSRKVYTMHQTLSDIYLKYQQKSIQYEKVLSDFAIKMKKVLVVVGTLHGVAIIMIILTPIVVLLYSGRRYMILLVHIPGWDITTDFGYFSTGVFHALCILLAGFGCYAGDTFVLLYLTHLLLFVEIFTLKVKDLNDMIEKDDDRDAEIHGALKDLVNWHQFYRRFNDDCNYIFYWMITVQILFSTTSIISTLLIILVGDWASAYPYLLFSVTALYIYCILGTRIQICNDRFHDEIYNINWYGLQVSEQKLVRLMLMCSQSQRYITIAGILPLTVNTALRITRIIYSMLMMLMQFIS